MAKTTPGRFFEDYAVGDVLHHAVPRTVSGGERALYHALYPARHALYSSDEFARGCGLAGAPLEDLAAFHMVFGKTVPDVSLNAVANLGYAEGRWHLPAYAGDTLRAESEVIGVKQNSNGKSGVVYVRTRGLNQRDDCVLDYVRWVMVRKGNLELPAPETCIPELTRVIPVEDLVIPEGLDFSSYNFTLAGEPHRWGDYAVGEQIDHIDGVTVEEAEHMLATRLWQNTAKVHFDTTARPDGSRLIYGGHVISMARALSFNGLANAQMIVGLNGGAHANPCTSGMTIRAWSEVLDKAETSAPGVGAIRLRLVATSGGAPFQLKGENGKYRSEVLLDLDYWALMPL
ncbi:L-erythro-3-methylmalyl-CoA dehydratase [Phaeobacter inhibens]|uniref:L-erythro-3-methylmalyl-CoA dehydratase n=1 Tax=Phaeobacter inhibens TaxID=221822 RepID=A0ABM6RHU7_9RHOB|nr:MaoC family dehydratase [Phaeobacter inhibens]AUQ51244.1 L-erythro-3-methylmalyl-CoA dehydratase [Phaeobacter inhibens]AUQ95763.1 L-erythro-3-methylmalyl-CoA dehydratase [Phaeobacter inhibens]AUR21049.1 L-erythro-3-methylmalyl-CoA dehydratase [Phaeobacter inhibens]